jgi:hypothetical protein
MKQVFKHLDVNTFIAVKKHYNSCVDANDFYKMLKRRIKYSKPKETAEWLKHELHYHYKECAQYI